MSGYLTISGHVYRWLLSARGLVLGQHTFTTEQVGLRTWRVSRVVAGKLDSHIVTLPHPAAPPPRLPFFGSKRPARKVTR